jgi:nicotinate-nucleotide adenylyltransferase
VKATSATEARRGGGARPRRVGVFGGTFNPVHACHLRVAEDCRRALRLDTVLFVPAGEPPVKRADVAPAADRFEMVRLAVAGHEGFAVSDVEVRRPGPSYTIDTLKALADEMPGAELVLLLGLDALLGIGAWHRPAEVLRAAPIATVFRPGARFAGLAELPELAGVDFAPLTALGGADPVRPLALASQDGIRLTLLKVAPCPVSGTRIRAALRKGARAVAGGVEGLPEPVLSYILRLHLYA